MGMKSQTTEKLKTKMCTKNQIMTKENKKGMSTEQVEDSTATNLYCPTSLAKNVREINVEGLCI